MVTANSAEPDQMPPTVASDQGLHYQFKGFSIKNRLKATNRSDAPKNTKLAHLIYDKR